MHFRISQAPPAGADIFKPPLMVVTALEQDDERQRGLTMSYARLTHKRAEVRTVIGILYHAATAIACNRANVPHICKPMY